MNGSWIKVDAFCCNWVLFGRRTVIVQLRRARKFGSFSAVNYNTVRCFLFGYRHFLIRKFLEAVLIPHQRCDTTILVFTRIGFRCPLDIDKRFRRIAAYAIFVLLLGWLLKTYFLRLSLIIRGHTRLNSKWLLFIVCGCYNVERSGLSNIRHFWVINK
jgi:hypothetical protein